MTDPNSIREGSYRFALTQICELLGVDTEDPTDAVLAVRRIKDPKLSAETLAAQEFRKRHPDLDMGPGCIGCGNYWGRKSTCAAIREEGAHNGRPWHEPTVAPPWCPGFEPQSLVHAQKLDNYSEAVCGAEYIDHQSVSLYAFDEVPQSLQCVECRSKVEVTP